MTAKESLNRDYGLLASFLKRISLRLQISVVLEFLLLLSSGFILILLGSLFALKLKETFPYLSFFYGLNINRGLKEGFMCTGIEPGHSTSHDLYLKSIFIEI